MKAEASGAGYGSDFGGLVVLRLLLGAQGHSVAQEVHSTPPPRPRPH